MSRRSASLAMYPFDALRPQYQRLWDAIVGRVPDLPPTLSWPTDVHATWTDDDIVVKQACGWPLVTRLGASVRVVGAFAHDVAEASGFRYRAAVVMARGRGIEDHSTVAYNSAESLSGWVSLIAWTGRSESSLRAGAVRTGSHLASLEAVASGRADVASIDAVTLFHANRLRPDLTTRLAVVGHGPLVPSLPVVVPASVDEQLLERLRDGFSAAVGDQDLVATCRALTITGFVPLDIDDYRRELAGLAPS